jgi:predicted Zn finger-like uncharacterized protein
MIVTCPGCSSKYRVKNDSVPADGAKMKCPKCNTMFLAKPPPPGASDAPHLEEPSSQFQQIAPQVQSNPNNLATARTPPPVPPPTEPPRVSGPVTSLFGAVDISQLPRDLPQQAAAPAPPSPTGLMLDTGAPKVRTPVMPSTGRLPTPAPIPSAPRGPSKAPYVVSALGVVTFLSGFLVFAWSQELLPLDAALTPVFAPLGAKPLAADAVVVDDLRATAKTAAEGGDLAGALLAWERVDARAKDDPQARTEMASLREKLGEKQTR